MNVETYISTVIHMSEDYADGIYTYLHNKKGMISDNIMHQNVNNVHVSVNVETHISIVPHNVIGLC